MAISSGGVITCAINSRALAVCWGSEFDGEEELTEKGRLKAISRRVDRCVRAPRKRGTRVLELR